MARKKGKDVFLGELEKNFSTFMRGAVKDAFGYEMSNEVASDFGERFSGFFSGIIDQFSNPPPARSGSRSSSRKAPASLPAGGAADYIDPDQLNGRKGLFVEFPIMIPISLNDGVIRLDLDGFDFNEEFNTIMEEWEEERVGIKVYTKNGSGPAYLIDPNDVEIDVYIGEEEDDSNTRSSRANSSGRGRGAARSRSAGRKY